MAICALCLKERKIRLSHIIPAFAFRWQKKTGGPIRNIETPNKRVQDGIKINLLCDDCESLLSVWESSFYNQLFLKYTENSDYKLKYGDWLLKFCVSLNWRTILYRKLSGLKGQYTPHQFNSMSIFEKNLHSVLIGESRNPSYNEQHLLFLNPISTELKNNLPPNINRYILRAIDFDIIGNQDNLLNMIKIGPIIILGYISSTEKLRRDTRGSRISVAGGSFRNLPSKFTNTLYFHLIERARRSHAILNSISDTQKNIIRDTFSKNILNYDDNYIFATILDLPFLEE